KSDAHGVTLKNVATPKSPGGECVEEGGCETTHSTPGKWTLEKTSDPASGSTVQPGSKIKYTVKATNSSSADVTGVEVVDDLTEVLKHTGNVSNITASVGSASMTDPNTLTWNLGTLAKNSSATVTYEVTIDDDAFGVKLVNAVTGDGSIPPTDCTEKDPCETTHTTPSWKVEKTSDPRSGSTVAAGSTITYTVKATNSGAVPIESVLLTDDLSGVLDHVVGGVTDIAWTTPTGSGTVLGDTPEFDAGTKSITGTITTLGAGSSVAMTYKVKLADDAHGVTVKNKAWGTSETAPPTDCDVEEPCSTTHKTPGKWTLAKTADPKSGSTVQPGSTIKYTLKAKNDSSADVTDVVVVDDLTKVLEHAGSLTVTPPAVGTTSLSGDGKTLTWNVGTLAKNSEATLTYSVKVNADAHGVTLKNAATGDGSVPPDECTEEKPCETTHSTPAKWTLAKTSDPKSGSTVQPGSTIKYTVKATNGSGADATDVVVVDDLTKVLEHAGDLTITPPAVGTTSLSGDGKTLTWNVGTLAKNSEATLTYSVKVNEDAFDKTLVNAVTGKGSVPPDECTEKEPCETTHVTPPEPKLTLVKEVKGNTETGGEAKPTDWTLKADGPVKVEGKTGSEDVTGVTVRAGEYALSESTGPKGYELATLTCVDAQGQQIEGVSTENASVKLALGDHVTCTFTNVAIAPEWTFFKSSNPNSGSTVKPGDTITYTVTAVPGQGVPTRNVVITDDMSAVLGNAELGTITASQGTAEVQEGTTNLVWTVGTLSEVQTLTYSVKVNADAVGVTLKNVVTGEGFTPPGECPEDDPDCRTTEHYTPEWTLVKSSDPASGSTVKPGDKVEYTLTAKNTSKKAELKGVKATDDLSEVLNNAELVEPLADGLTKAGDTTLEWAVPTLAPGESAEVKYSVTVNADAIGVTLKNVVTGDETVPPAPCPEDDPDCRTTEHYTPEWTLVKSSDPASGSTVKPGDKVEYTLTVKNTGPVPLTGAKATDDLSGVLGNAKLSEPLADGLTLDGTTLTWAIPEVPVDGTVKVSYTVTVNADAWGETIRNVVTGEGPVPPSPCPETDPDCRETEHLVPAWSLKKTSNPASGTLVSPGSVVEYTLTATNVGPTEVKDAVVTDDMSKVLSNATISGSLPAGATLSGTTLTWKVPTLAKGASASITYKVKVNTGAHNVKLVNVATPSEGGACEPGKCSTTHVTPPPLPVTGGPATWMAIPIALALAGLGGGLFVLDRRRRRGQEVVTD
ncbi:MAG: isopeptide-forming domain-containing fimbrial protein, partial [Leucobacter sp.]